ncbi:MAG: EAL domain-containing protein [Leptolyngbyaceae cyanobacterium SM1_1_3]|nr:EAL domain-containing protein [Leptolyngbyaceae cyanobacterium SM1_1_3]
MTRYQPDLVNQLCFELDEPSLLGDLDQSVRFIQEIRALGFAVAIDNISNFSKLRTLLKSVSVEYLKINSYGLETTYRDLLLLQSEQKMPLKIIAVRVENKALLEKAEDLCVDYAQGYAIEVPQPLRVLNLVA